MNENLAIALVGAFGGFVAFCTAVLGYFKVWKQPPSSSNGGKNTLSGVIEYLQQRVEQQQADINEMRRRHEEQIAKLEEEVLECHRERDRQRREIDKLKKRKPG